MRVIASYAVSTLLHMAVAVGIVCWIAAGDTGPVLMPGAGNGGGMNLDSDVGGIPGGNPLPTTVVYVQFHPSAAEAADAAAPPMSEPPIEPGDITETQVVSAPSVALEPTETPIERSEVTETTRASLSVTAPEGPALQLTETTALDRPQRKWASAPTTEMASAAPPAAAFSRSVAKATMSTQLPTSVPPVDVGTGAGGTGEGGGRGNGNGGGGGGGGAGGSVDALPVKGFGNIPPTYPRDAVLARAEGRVVLRVKVTAEGGVESLKVDKSSNWPSLDEAALIAVKAWRFYPARRSGIAVPFEVLVPVNFQLVE
jgi:periplasmic protein TonB